MHKQTIGGVVGILLSCLLLVFGWFFTVTLLSQNETVLLSERGTVELTPKVPNTAQGVPDDNVTAYMPATLAEIVHILHVWETQSNVVPHEPFNGQLTMEQAAATGKAWIEKCSEEATLPSFVDGAKMNAFLCANELAPDTLVPEVSPALGAIRGQQELTPYFSYWTVRFEQEGFSATLIINAATGQVWRAEIKLSTTDTKADIDIEKILSAFLRSLSLTEDEILVRDGQTASHSFGNGALLGIAETSSTADTQTINLYLTTK